MLDETEEVNQSQRRLFHSARPKKNCTKKIPNTTSPLASKTLECNRNNQKQRNLTTKNETTGKSRKVGFKGTPSRFKRLY